MWLVIGVALLTGAVAAIYFSTRNDLLASYNSAPTCPAFSDALDGKDCRYTGTATVTNITGDTGGISVYFNVPGQFSPFFMARLPLGVQTDPSLRVEVQVEFWRFRVTRFGGATTADNPVSDPRPRTLLVIGLLLTPLGLAATFWAVVTARNPSRWTQSQQTAASMSPIATSDALWR